MTDKLPNIVLVFMFSTKPPEAVMQERMIFWWASMPYAVWDGHHRGLFLSDNFQDYLSYPS
jgi:hypothetical protein